MMQPERLSRRLLAEGLGSALLAATVVGSGIMAERLAGGNVAVALLANTGATVAVLYTLIALLGPVSGAHFNPAVSSIEALRGRDAVARRRRVLGNPDFGLLRRGTPCAPDVRAARLAVINARSQRPAQWLAEAIATLGLLLVVIGHRRAEDAPWMVACWIGAAYWFTASTSFANPAITIARSLTDTFSGIRPIDAPGFIAAQFVGAIAAWAISLILFPATKAVAPPAGIEKTNEPTDRKRSEALHV